jgi:F-type H+-transporting ATPase subunit epsilon
VRESDMPITMQLDIVSAEREIFSGVVQYVVATGQLGEIGIKPGHAPLLTILKPGLVTVTLADGQEMVLYVSGGMLEVQPFYTTILADEVERAEDLDEASALEAKKRAETLMQNKNEKIDFSVAAAELARAVAQIRAIQKIRKQL